MSSAIALDLETLGTNHMAPIVSIGAVALDSDWKFYAPIALDDLRYTDAHTIRWWMRQSEEARAVFHQPAQAEAAAVMALAEFQPTEVWTWGTMDHAVLQSAFRRAGVSMPWDHRDWRDLRTLAAVIAPHGERRPTEIGVAHNALDDARWVRSYLQALS